MKFLSTLFLLTLASCVKPQVKLPPDPHLLVIGDSISIGYTPYLQDGLADVMTVSHPDDNCRYSAYTLEHIDEWISEKTPTVITWNNGMWDCATSTQSTEEEYIENLINIASKLSATGAKVYWVTTTQIPDLAVPKGYIQGCEVRRNELAVHLMSELGIDVIDLYSLSRTFDRQTESDDVHFVDVEYEALGNEVLRVVREDLE